MFKSYNYYINKNYINEGFIQGFVSDNDIDFLDFINKYDYLESDIKNIEKYKNCNKAYISVIYMDKQFRGNKNGTLLLEQMLFNIYKDYNVKYIFLISYNEELNNFSLIKWYNSYGFYEIANKSNCPLMVLEDDSLLN